MFIGVAFTTFFITVFSAATNTYKLIIIYQVIYNYSHNHAIIWCDGYRGTSEPSYWIYC